MLHISDLAAGDPRATTAATLTVFVVLFAFAIVLVPLAIGGLLHAIWMMLVERRIHCRNPRCGDWLTGGKGEHAGICASCWAAGRMGAELAMVAGFIGALPWLPLLKWLKLALGALSR